MRKFIFAVLLIPGLLPPVSASDGSSSPAGGFVPVNASTAAPAGKKISKTEWKLKETNHFSIYYTYPWNHGNIHLDLERIYSLIHLNMNYFAPWMQKEKPKIYIYDSRKEYEDGEFRPPKWSEGIAIPVKKTVVVFESNDSDALKGVLVHELTHLFLEGYYMEKNAPLPLWLNEGLAVYMQDISYSGGGVWAAGLKNYPKDVYMPFRKFFKSDLSGLKDDAISMWYLQAFGAVNYLFTSMGRIRFQTFCKLIRDGETEEKALWDAFRFSSVENFQSKWFAWLGTRDKDSGMNSNFMSGGFTNKFEFEPMKMSGFPTMQLEKKQ